jgi:hypothetical protein
VFYINTHFLRNSEYSVIRSESTDGCVVERNISVIGSESTTACVVEWNMLSLMYICTEYKGKLRENCRTYL